MLSMWRGGRPHDMVIWLLASSAACHEIYLVFTQIFVASPLPSASFSTVGITYGPNDAVSWRRETPCARNEELSFIIFSG